MLLDIKHKYDQNYFERKKQDGRAIALQKVNKDKNQKLIKEIKTMINVRSAFIKTSYPEVYFYWVMKNQFNEIYKKAVSLNWNGSVIYRPEYQQILSKLNEDYRSGLISPAQYTINRVKAEEEYSAYYFKVKERKDDLVSKFLFNPNDISGWHFAGFLLYNGKGQDLYELYLNESGFNYHTNVLASLKSALDARLNQYMTSAINFRQYKAKSVGASPNYYMISMYNKDLKNFGDRTAQQQVYSFNDLIAILDGKMNSVSPSIKTYEANILSYDIKIQELTAKLASYNVEVDVKPFIAEIDFQLRTNKEQAKLLEFQINDLEAEKDSLVLLDRNTSSTIVDLNKKIAIIDTKIKTKQGL